jgi:hypothetical protein
MDTLQSMSDSIEKSQPDAIVPATRRGCGERMMSQLHALLHFLYPPAWLLHNLHHKAEKQLSNNTHEVWLCSSTAWAASHFTTQALLKEKGEASAGSAVRGTGTQGNADIQNEEAQVEKVGQAARLVPNQPGCHPLEDILRILCTLLSDLPGVQVEKVYRCLSAAPPPLGRLVHWVETNVRQPGK